MNPHYRQYIQQKADEGCEVAKFLLSKELIHAEPNSALLIRKLHSAQANLTQALTYNGYEWTRKTDEQIQDAHSIINDVIAQLGS